MTNKFAFFSIKFLHIPNICCTFAAKSRPKKRSDLQKSRPKKRKIERDNRDRA